MLHQFLAANRLELIERCRFKVARRPAPEATPAELEHGVPLFLDQLTRALLLEQSSEPLLERLARRQSGEAGRGSPESPEIGKSAILHGHELLKHGFTVDQVVHDYADLSQAVTELATEQHAPIEVDEFRTLNRCLDNAIAGAVTEFTSRHDFSIASQTAQALDGRLRTLAAEANKHIEALMLGLAAVKSGDVGLQGATGAMLNLSLVSLRSLMDRMVAKPPEGSPGA